MSASAEQRQFEADITAALPALRLWALRLYRSEADADDAVQDAVEQALISRNRPTTATVRTWMGSIIYFRFLNALKRRRVEYCGIADDYAAEIAGTDDQHAALEARQTLALIAERLRPKKFEVVVRHVVGFGEAEIADAVGCPPGTVKSRLFKARRQLETIMREEAA